MLTFWIDKSLWKVPKIWTKIDKIWMRHFRWFSNTVHKHQSFALGVIFPLSFLRSLEDKKARKCPHCEKTYVSMPAYSMHIRTHNQGCKCPFCGKCFSRPWLLQGHIRTHTGMYHIVWKSPKMSHLKNHQKCHISKNTKNVTFEFCNFGTLHQTYNFCPIESDLSGNTVKM